MRGDDEVVWLRIIYRGYTANRTRVVMCGLDLERVRAALRL